MRRTNRNTPLEAETAPCKAGPPPLRALRSPPQASRSQEIDFSCQPPEAGCRCLSIALPGGFGCNLSATRNVIRASDARRGAVGDFCRSCASSTPGAVVFGYFPDDLERFGLLLVDLGHFVFIG